MMLWIRWCWVYMMMLGYIMMEGVHYDAEGTLWYWEYIMMLGVHYDAGSTLWRHTHVSRRAVREKQFDMDFSWPFNTFITVCRNELPSETPTYLDSTRSNLLILSNDKEYFDLDLWYVLEKCKLDGAYGNVQTVVVVLGGGTDGADSRVLVRHRHTQRGHARQVLVICHTHTTSSQCPRFMIMGNNLVC